MSLVPAAMLKIAGSAGLFWRQEKCSFGPWQGERSPLPDFIHLMTLQITSTPVICIFYYSRVYVTTIQMTYLASILGPRNKKIMNYSWQSGYPETVMDRGNSSSTCPISCWNFTTCESLGDGLQIILWLAEWDSPENSLNVVLDSISLTLELSFGKRWEESSFDIPFI